MQLQSFRAARWVRTFNLVLQAVLFLTLFLGLNYLALNHPSRYDLTKQRRYSLSPETLSWVRSLKVPVRMIVTTTEDNDNPDVRGLLREYTYATETNPNGKITVDYLDVYQRRREADALGLDQANVIVLLSGGKQRALTVDQLYETGKNKEGKAERQKFIGEQVVTAALLDISNPTRKKIYFLTGNGELSPDSSDAERGLSVLREQLRVRNFEVDQLDITTTRRVPEDANLVIAIAPQNVTPFVQEQLRQYLTTSAGRMILMLAPTVEHGLGSLLFDDWGVVADDDILWDTDPQFVAENGDMMIKAFLPHPVTQSLLNLSSVPQLRSGAVRTVRSVPAGSATGLTVSTLAASSTTAWGERSYRSSGAPSYTRGVDLKGTSATDGRLGVVVASERVGTKGNLDFSVPRGRLVVFGMADLVTNKRIGIVGNLAIFLNAVNWTVDRDTQLNIPARPIERFQISLSAEQMLRLRYSLLFVLPGIAALLALTVYWTRRT